MKKRHSGPHIVDKLRQADVLIGRGKTVPTAWEEIEVSERTLSIDKNRKAHKCFPVKFLAPRGFEPLLPG